MEQRWELVRSRNRQILVRRSVVVGLLLVATSVGACDDNSNTTASGEGGAPRETAVVEPTRFGACGRLVFYGVTDDEGGALLLRFDLPSGGDIDQSFTLPNDAVQREVLLGEQVDDPLCNDLRGQEHRVDQRLQVSAGTVRVRIEGNSAALDFDGLAVDGGAELRLDHASAVIGPLGG